jgi:hypothetical protein
MSFVSAVNVYATQNEFYGTWVGSATDHDGVYELKITISDRTFLLEMIGIFNNGETETFNGTMEIITWIESINAETTTRNDFPNGYILRAKREDDSIINIMIYISRNKSQIIIPTLDIETDVKIIYRKR